jgi:hypothetical protein
MYKVEFENSNCVIISKLDSVTVGEGFRGLTMETRGLQGWVGLDRQRRFCGWVKWRLGEDSLRGVRGYLGRKSGDNIYVSLIHNFDISEILFSSLY